MKGESRFHLFDLLYEVPPSLPLSMNAFALPTLLAPLLAVQGFAQSPQTGGPVARSPLMAESHSVPWVTEVPAVLGMPVLPTNVLFQEDFANGFAGNNGVGGWTAEDSGGGAIWQYVNASGAGTYANGAPSNAFPPAGEFSTTAGQLASASADNGWVIFDCDFYNTPISNGLEDVQGWIASPVLDFSTNSSVLVSWQHYFRYCCYPSAPIFLQVSSDGGSSWTTFDGHGTFVESANAASANPLNTVVDISCAAAGYSNVQIRFSYLQPNEVGSGYSHYYWGLDDVVIYENQAAHDLVIKDVLLTNPSQPFEYATLPLEQAVPSEQGGLTLAVRYRNQGVADQTDASLFVEVLDASGATVHEATQFIGWVPGPVNGATCPPNEWELAYVETGWEPADTGHFVVRTSLSSAFTDATPLDKPFIVSASEMGHDVEPLDLELFPAESQSIAGFAPTGHGNFFQMNQVGSEVHGLAVNFGPNVGGPGLEFETRLYTYTGEYSLVESPYVSNTWVLDGTWSLEGGDANGFVYLPFSTPIPLETGVYYFAAVVSEVDLELPLTVLANSQGNTDNSTGKYAVSGAGDYQWFFSQQHTPAIRLVLDPAAYEASGCTDAAACNFSDFAVEDDGSCEYESCLGCGDEAACNFDASAWLTSPDSCTYPGCLDPEATNYTPEAGCSGACTYLSYDCASIGAAAWAGEASGIFPSWQSAMYGVEWNGEWVFNIGATVVDPSSGVTYDLHHLEGLALSGTPSGLVHDVPTGSISPSGQHCIPASGVPDAVGVYSVGLSAEVFISIFGQPFSIGGQTFTASMEVLANPNPIPGCTYATAVNYSALATVDDGGCQFAGCTDASAANFTPLATLDDGSCLEACDDGASSGCASDSNGDGVVTVSDLLVLLGEFGADCL